MGADATEAAKKKYGHLVREGLFQIIGELETRLAVPESQDGPLTKIRQKIIEVYEEYYQFRDQNDHEVSTGMARLWGVGRIRDQVLPLIAEAETQLSAARAELDGEREEITKLGMKYLEQSKQLTAVCAELDLSRRKYSSYREEAKAEYDRYEQQLAEAQAHIADLTKEA